MRDLRQENEAAADEEAEEEQAAPDGELLPDQAAEEQVAPDGEVAPDEAAEEQVAPDGEVAPDEVAPDEVAPDEVTPDEVAPDEAPGARADEAPPQWSDAAWRCGMWMRSQNTWRTDYGGFRQTERYRHGNLGGRRRHGNRGGHDQEYYAGFYAAKGKGKAALEAYVAQHGYKGRGGSAFHDRKEDLDVDRFGPPAGDAAWSWDNADVAEMGEHPERSAAGAAAMDEMIQHASWAADANNDREVKVDPVVAVVEAQNSLCAAEIADDDSEGWGPWQAEADRIAGRGEQRDEAPHAAAGAADEVRFMCKCKCSPMYSG